MYDHRWIWDEANREQLVSAYARWVKERDERDEWANATIGNAAWRGLEPMRTLELAIAAISRVADDPVALNYIGAGPLEVLIQGGQIIRERITSEARHNEAFRLALAAVYPVRHRDEGFEALHDLVFA